MARRVAECTHAHAHGLRCRAAAQCLRRKLGRDIASQLFWLYERLRGLIVVSFDEWARPVAHSASEVVFTICKRRGGPCRPPSAAHTHLAVSSRRCLYDGCTAGTPVSLMNDPRLGSRKLLSPALKLASIARLLVYIFRTQGDMHYYVHLLCVTSEILFLICRHITYNEHTEQRTAVALL